MTDWRAVTSDPAFLTAVESPDRMIGFRAVIVDPAGNEIDTIPAESGAVDFDGESKERWEAELVLTDPDWVPEHPSDPLDGRSGYRTRIYWQLLDPETVTVAHEVLLCTVYLEDPHIHDDGTTVTVTVKGFDPVNMARRGGYGGRTVDVSGMTVSAALAVTLEALGVSQYRITASSATLPDPYVLGALKDPWKDITDLAAMAGCDVWSDRDGVVLVAPRPDPQTPRLNWQEGPSCPVVELDRNPRTSSINNRVVVVSTSPDVSPISVVVEDIDPASPTWVGGRFGVREVTIESDKITDEAGAYGIGNASYARWIRGTDDLSMDVPQRPDLEFRDLIPVSSRRAKVNGLWRFRGFRIPLTAAGVAPGLMRVRMQTRSLV